eukprot:1919787-Pyramimonas_sp.AAC.1
MPSRSPSALCRGIQQTPSGISLAVSSKGCPVDPVCCGGKDTLLANAPPAGVSSQPLTTDDTFPIALESPMLPRKAHGTRGGT